MPRVSEAKIVHVGDDQWHHVVRGNRFTICRIALNKAELQTMRPLLGSGVTNICQTCSEARFRGG